jgi:RimJ/RimL family protein N-acetyltransferase
MNSHITTPLGGVAIRAAGVEDATAYRELRLEALQNHPEVFGSDYETAVARSATFWAERLSLAGTPGSAMTYLACHETEPVGLCGLAINDARKSRHSANLISMYVRPAWRRVGIADALIAACLEWARGRDIKIVKLAVVTTNVGALRCYERNGFTPYGTEPQALYHHGVYYDELLMSRAV